MLFRISFFLIIISIISGALFGAVIEQTYKFTAPQIIHQGQSGQIVSFGNSYQAGQLGHPTIPVQPVAILLPTGQTATRIQINFSGERTIPEKINLAPRQHPQNSSNAGQVPFEKNEAIYTTTVPIEIPQGRLETHYLHGHPVALSSFSPVSYIPASQTLSYFSKAVVQIETISGSRPHLPPSFAHHVKQALSALVDNKNEVEYQFGNCFGTADYDYLIITIDEFTDDYEPLSEYYNERGIRTKIQTVEFINREISGNDTPERIRNYIIEQYSNHGIQYVLLAGDADAKTGGELQVPVRGFYCEVQSSQVYRDFGIPSDLYYSALDGNWNDNEDQFWGEPGEDDLLPEVAVGRICADNPREIFNMIQKIIHYQSFPVVNDIPKVLMAGETMWSNPDTDGGDYLDLLISGSSENGYETVGMPPELNFTFFYERNGYWNSKELLTEISTGCNFLFHAGHSNESSIMKFSLASISESNFQEVDGVNHLNPVIYSHGCLAAAIDRLSSGNIDCIAEQMLSLPYFAVAFVGNTRYGWFDEGLTEGPSAHLHREFVHSLYSVENTRLGGAHLVSRLRTAPFVTIPDEFEPGANRWTFYGCNVLGDPAMDLWTYFVDKFQYVTFPDTISNGDPIFISTQVPDARLTLSNANGTYFSAISDAGGTATFSVDSVTTTPEWKLVITRHNFLPFEATIATKQEPQTHVRATQNEITPVNFSLSPAYPNPFNPETTIRYTLAQAGKINLSIYNLAGQRVENLESGNLAAGSYSVTWRAAAGSPSGICYICLENREARLTRRVVLLK